MRRTFYLATVVVAVVAQAAIAQDDGEDRIKRALEGRLAVVKLDLPAIDTGVSMTFDDAVISFDEATYKRLLKDYGVAIPKGTRSRITAVRVSSKGIEIDLDGGGLPGREWMVGGMVLTEPQPLGRSDREVELERQLQQELNSGRAAVLRADLEYERERRLAQDERNRQAFEQVARFRREYIDKNRKSWGSKIIIFVRSRKPNVTMRDMMASLSKHIELLPREPPPRQ